MNVGLPGTSIGGLFYVLTAAWMPLREFVRLARGKSTLMRWKFIAAKTSIAAGMLGSLWITGKFLEAVLPIQTIAKGSVLLLSNARIFAANTTIPTVTTFIVLAGVLGVVEVMRLFVKGRKRIAIWCGKEAAKSI
jgi:hypothetical protein